MSDHPHAIVSDICASVGFSLAKGDAEKIFARAGSLEPSAIFEAVKSMDFPMTPERVEAIDVNFPKKLKKSERRIVNNDLRDRALSLLKTAIREVITRHSGPRFETGAAHADMQRDFLRAARNIVGLPEDSWSAPLKNLTKDLDDYIVAHAPQWRAASLIKPCIALARDNGVFLFGKKPKAEDILAAGNVPDAWLEGARVIERNALRAFAIGCDVSSADALLTLIRNPIENEIELSKFRRLLNYRGVMGVTSENPLSNAAFVIRLLSVFGASETLTPREAEELVAARKYDEQRLEKAREDARRVKALWEASLMTSDLARDFLGAKPTEFARWVGEGRIPVGKRTPFVKWGQKLEAKFYDPVVLEGLKTQISEWRRADLAAKHRARAANKPPGKTDEQAALLARIRSLLKSGGCQGVSPFCLGEGVFLRAKSAHRLPFSRPGGEVATVEAVHAVELPAYAFESIATTPVSRHERAVAVQTLVDTSTSLFAVSRGRVDAAIGDWEERVATLARDYAEDARARFDAILAEVWTRSNWKPDHDGQSGSDIAARLFRVLIDVLAESSKFYQRREKTFQVRLRSGMTDFPGLFPMARAMRRRLVLNVGPTNSGKTHAALDALAKAKTGVYAAPLRLLALEAHERMIEERKTPCSMITGEERIWVEDARHVACTIEMTDLHSPVDVAVIDEVQLLGDSDRGWAWTAAVIGVPAATVIMTGSPDAVDYVEAIAAMTGESLEIRRHERKTPLTPMDRGVRLDDLERGDAVIAFSRGEVMRLRQTLISMNFKVAVVYGALGPEVRRAEARRFREGDADILIATDAIGMGLNLPCRRVIFSQLSKFDGERRRRLTSPEIRQIAGRAGRFGQHEAGFVGVFAHENPHAVTAALSAAPSRPDDLRPFVMPPSEAIREISDFLGTENLVRILQYFESAILEGDQALRSATMESALVVARAIDGSGLDLMTKVRYLGAPIETKTTKHFSLVFRWSQGHGKGFRALAPEFVNRGVPDTDEHLCEIEESAKELTLYLWLSQRWPDIYNEHAEADERRRSCNRLIEDALQISLWHRTCRQCGRKLRENHKFPICDDCFRSSYFD